MSGLIEFLSRAVDTHVWWPIVVGLLLLAFFIGAATQSMIIARRIERRASMRSGRHPAGRAQRAAVPPAMPAPSPPPPSVRSAVTDADRQVWRRAALAMAADPTLCRNPVRTSLGDVQCLRRPHEGPCL